MTRPRKFLSLLGALLLAFLLSPAGASALLDGPEGAPATADDVPMISFEDRLTASGINFQHYGERYRWCKAAVDPTIAKQAKGLSTNEKIDIELFEDPAAFAQRHLIRMNGSGAAWIDYDGDGDWDLYLLNGKGEGEKGPETNQLYRNDGGGKFVNVTEGSGAADQGEGMAVSVADYDNDGHTDIFVTNYGDFAIYRNKGDGTFENTTKKAFASCPPKDRWYAGSAWGDMDKDGDLDLYVAGYVDIEERPKNYDVRFPMDFEGYDNTLFENQGDGTFADVTKKAGVNDVARKTMQVLFADFNSDGNPDLLVANDTDPNSLYIGKGDGTFFELSGASGVSSTDGSMGIAWGDYDGDGKMDLTMSNYIGEHGRLLRLADDESSNEGTIPNAIFEADFDSPDFLKASWAKVGWGTALEDLDNDGDLDLFLANGHLNAIGGDNRDLNLCFMNDGQGRFQDVSKQSGVLATGKRIHRGAAVADYDHDGRIDFYICNNGEKSYDAKEDRLGVLLTNTSPSKHHWLTLRFRGTKSNRDGYGTRVQIWTGEKMQVRELVSGQGYFYANAKELHFGLADAAKITKMRVQWPSGLVQEFQDVAADRILDLVEGENLPKDS